MDLYACSYQADNPSNKFANVLTATMHHMDLYTHHMLIAQII